MIDQAGPDYDAGEPGEVLRASFRCERPSRYAGWLLPDGRIIPARCGAPNKCAYCAYQTAVENAIVVALDAERYGYPNLVMTLTTAGPIDSGRFNRGVERVFDVVRREHGRQVAYLGLLEFTRGTARRSGGVRRPHEHLLLKGVPAAHDYDYLEDEVRHEWCRHTGAHVVELAEIRSAAGATAYLTHHHNKREQRPPAGWSGKRMRPSHGYYGAPVKELRKEAGELLRSKRLRKVARRLIEWETLDGAPDELLEQELAAALAEAKAAAAQVVFVKLSHDGGITGRRRRVS